MSISEEQVSLMNEGKRAYFLLSEMAPIFKEVRENILAEQQMVFRSGEVSEAKLVASVAKLCTLVDIEDLLKAKISVSEQIAKEII